MRNASISLERLDRQLVLGLHEPEVTVVAQVERLRAPVGPASRWTSARNSSWSSVIAISCSPASDPGGSASASCLRASWSRGVPECSMSIATK